MGRMTWRTTCGRPDRGPVHAEQGVGLALQVLAAAHGGGAVVADGRRPPVPPVPRRLSRPGSFLGFRV